MCQIVRTALMKRHAINESTRNRSITTSTACFVILSNSNIKLFERKAVVDELQKVNVL